MMTVEEEIRKASACCDTKLPSNMDHALLYRTVMLDEGKYEATALTAEEALKFTINHALRLFRVIKLDRIEKSTPLEFCATVTLVTFMHHVLMLLTRMREKSMRKTLPPPVPIIVVAMTAQALPSSTLMLDEPTKKTLQPDIKLASTKDQTLSFSIVILDESIKKAIPFLALIFAVIMAKTLPCWTVIGDETM
jgi:hypothetical protein